MARIVVYHDTYGCDTGCCGHTVEIEGGRSEFLFDHPRGFSFLNKPPLEGIEFAKACVIEAFGEEHVADLDWEQCVIFDD